MFAATVGDVAQSGFEDLTIYDQLRLPTERRSIREDPDGGDLRAAAVAVLHDWRQQARERSDD